MTLQINGNPREFPEGLTLAALITQLGMKTDRVAVELNLEIVPRARWDSTILKDADKLEIVHFVGGGREAGLGTEAMARGIESDAAGWSCPSCRAGCSGAFCANCGEKKPSPHDLSLGHLLSHAGEALFHWDSKIFRTLRVLLTQPGRLEDDYVKGRRKPYVHPFQVFLICNLLYFLLYPVIGWSGLKTPLSGYQHWMPYSGWATHLAADHAARLGISMADLGRRFDRAIDIQSRSLVLLMVPLFTLALLVLEWRPRRYVGEHLVFALHYLGAALILFFIMLSGGVSLIRRVCLALGTNPHFLQRDSVLSSVGALVMGAYLFVALSRFYKDFRIAALAKSAVLIGATYGVVQIYRIVLFLTALYSV